MRSARSCWSACTLLVVVVALSLVSRAEAGAPTERIRGAVDQVVKILEDPAVPPLERRAAIRRLAQTMFDFRELSRRALGRHWLSLSEPERAEFAGLFGALLERAYASQLEHYSGERIAYAGESVQEGLATVRTRLMTRDGEVRIDYRMAGRGAHWRVADVVIEGVSMTASYRSQFDRVIQSSSFQELLRRMRATASAQHAEERQGS